MRANVKFQTILIGIIALSAILTGCKKDRIIQDDYSSMDSFYDTHKDQEQVFIIDSTSQGPIIGRHDTKIYVSKDMFMKPDSTDITWPYIIKLVEVYPVKDIIMWEYQTLAGNSILESAAEIRVRAFKDNTELLLKPGRKYYMELDTMSNLVNNMQVYYGFDNGSIPDWTNNLSSISPISPDTLTAITTTPYLYAMFIARMGWVNCARPHVSSASMTTIGFSANGNNTQNIDVFIVFDGYKSVMQVRNFLSQPVPVGETVRIIAMAKNQNNDYVLHDQIMTVASSPLIILNMQVISEPDLLALLNSL